MAEKVEQRPTTANNANDSRSKMQKPSDFQQTLMTNNINPGIITRERSFVRTSNQQNINKRRSLAFNVQNAGGNGNGQVQMRGKPAMDIYRPPSFNFNHTHNHSLQHSSSSSMVFPGMGNGATTPTSPVGGGMGMQAKASASLQQQMQYVAASNAAAAAARRQQAGLSMGSMPLNSAIIGGKGGAGGAGGVGGGGAHRPILVTHSHPMQMNSLAHQMPLINSPSSGNILHQTAGPNRVKFAAEPQKHHHNNNNNNGNNNNNNNSNAGNANKSINRMVNMYNSGNNNNGNYGYQQQQQQQQQQQIIDSYNSLMPSPLQRSKSLSSADALARGIAGLGLALGNEITDIGQFVPEIQVLVDTALDDPNKLNSRSLMELTWHFIKRAVEGRRYALPIARLCLNIIAKEQKETFLEALLNTCRQWYQEREKLLFAIAGMKSPSRVRFTAFMAFLTEMFCQLKRRQLQLRTQSEGAPPPLILLTLLSKCCEDCVKPPVRSLAEIECLFYVLTCIGLDMEMHMPQQLELLLSMVRDAFLNANDSAPAIRRTLLQLIELQASHWQLAGTSVLYYYPSSK